MSAELGQEAPDLPRDPAEAIAEAQANQEAKDVPQAVKDALEDKIAGSGLDEPLEMP